MCARVSSSKSRFADGVTREQARKDIETIAHEVLANPVIEEYRIEISSAAFRPAASPSPRPL